MAAVPFSEYVIHDNGGRPFRVIIRGKPGSSDTKLSSMFPDGNIPGSSDTKLSSTFPDGNIPCSFDTKLSSMFPDGNIPGSFDTKLSSMFPDGNISGSYSVDIFKAQFNDMDERSYVLFRENITPLGVFVGSSPINRMTIFSGGHGEWAKGNSILLHLKANRYMFIGSTIYEFDSYEPIVRFVSPVGNSDVPYPYAYDANNNAYLFAFDCVVKNCDKINQMIEDERKFNDLGIDTREKIKAQTNKNFSDGDPNNYYMDNSALTEDMYLRDPKHVPVVYPYKQFYIGKTPYTMSIHMNPAYDYDRFMSDSFASDQVDKYGVSVVDNSGVKTMLSKEDYCRIIHEFNNSQGFQPFLNVSIVHERI